MSGRWVDVSTLEPERTPFWRTPLVWVIASFAVLAALIVTGVLIYNRGGDDSLSAVTIAELRADPSEYDGSTVELVGTAEDVRTLPVLDQYGIYTFRDESGSMLVLTRHGSPPTDEPLTLTGTYHSDLRLDERLEALIEDQLGPLAGAVAGALVPGIPLNVVFIEHDKYELQSESGL